MNKTPFNESSNSEDELLPEYQFDYKKAKPNRFANRSGKQPMTVVVLDEDIAPGFFNTGGSKQGASGPD